MILRGPGGVWGYFSFLGLGVEPRLLMGLLADSRIPPPARRLGHPGVGGLSWETLVGDFRGGFVWNTAWTPETKICLSAIIATKYR